MEVVFNVQVNYVGTWVVVTSASNRSPSPHLCPDHGDATADSDRRGGCTDGSALLVGEHHRVEINSDQELPFTCFLQIGVIGGAGGNVVGQRDDYAAVDVSGRVAVMCFDADSGESVRPRAAVFHADVFVECHVESPLLETATGFLLRMKKV